MFASNPLRQAAGGLALAVPAARRRRGRSARREALLLENYETRGPVRGYEGYVAPDYYCSYKRYPNRECSVGRAEKSAAAS